MEVGREKKEPEKMGTTKARKHEKERGERRESEKMGTTKARKHEKERKERGEDRRSGQTTDIPRARDRSENPQPACGACRRGVGAESPVARLLK